MKPSNFANLSVNTDWLFRALPPTAVITVPLKPDTTRRHDEPWIQERIWSDDQFGEIKDGCVRERPSSRTILIGGCHFEQKDRARIIATYEKNGWYGEDMSETPEREAYTLLRRRPKTAPSS